MKTIFKPLLAVIAVLFAFSAVAASEEISMSLSDMDKLYFSTLGDLNGNERMPFPTLFIYDHESKKILSKAQMITSFGSKIPLNFVKHDEIERVIENDFLTDLNKGVADKARYSVIYFVVFPSVFNDPVRKSNNQKVKQLFADNPDYNLIKLYASGC